MKIQISVTFDYSAAKITSENRHFLIRFLKLTRHLKVYIVTLTSLLTSCVRTASSVFVGTRLEQAAKNL